MLKIQPYSYHNHTVFSDGHNTLEEMVAAAKKIGFTEMGVSDHLIVHKNMKRDVSWPMLRGCDAPHVYNDDFKSILDAYKYHCEHIRRVARKENFKLYVGFEVDYFPYDGWLEEFKWFVSQLDYDYLQTGNHFFCEENCEDIINMTFFKKVCTDTSLYKEYTRRHFETMCQAVETGMFKFLAHIDYVRKYGPEVYDIDDFATEKDKIIDALLRTNTALEISTKGLRKIGDFYPDDKLITKAADKGVIFIVSDDAHKTEELGADFDKAEAVLAKHHITKILKF
jgi:histidinol-phosphatase (PHP family)